MKRLIVDAEAEAELVEAMARYEQRREGLGHELHAEVQAVLDRIHHFPSRGWKVDDDGHRVMPVDRFPYLVFYEVLEESLWVAAIAHQTRRTGYWHDRERPSE